MKKKIFVMHVSELPNGTMKTVFIDGTGIVCINIDDTIFAMQDTCTHSNCSLGQEGLLDDDRIVCGCHGAAFAIRTGEVLSPPAVEPLHVYSVSIEDDSVYIQ